MNSTTIPLTWGGVRLEKALLESIDKTISSIHVYGAKKYVSRSEFVKEACIQLLEKERGIRQVKEATI